MSRAKVPRPFAGRCRVMLAAKAQGTARTPGEGLRDVATLRGLFSAQGLLALFDAPWLLVYVAVIWLFHPILGIAAAVSAAMMVLLALLNDRMTRRGIETLHARQRIRPVSGNSLDNATSSPPGHGRFLYETGIAVTAKCRAERPIARTTSQ